MSILLVLDQNPEQVIFFALDEESEEAAWALASAGKYINCNDISEDAQKLNNWLGGRPHLSNPAIGPFSQVVLCGFVL